MINIFRRKVVKVTDFSSYLLVSGVNVSLEVFGKVESGYWKNNPGSENRIPKSTPFIPILTTNQVAKYIVEMIEKNKRILIKPGIFRTLSGHSAIGLIR